jgi:hypothetical protein
MSSKLGSIAAVGAALIALGFVVGAAAQARAPVAHAAKTCHLAHHGEGYGYTYVTSLTVSRTTCKTGITVVRHKGKLKGWHCRNKILDHSPIQYDARKTCTNHRKRVVFGYTQNTA